MPDDTPLITAYLADRHVPCPACGYDLQGVADVKCPECGQHLTLTLGLDNLALTRIDTATQAIGWALASWGVLHLAYRGYAWWEAAQLGGGSPYSFTSWLYWLATSMYLLQVPVGFWIVARSRRRAPHKSPATRSVSTIRFIAFWIILSFAFQIGPVLLELLLM